MNNPLHDSWVEFGVSMSGEFLFFTQQWPVTRNEVWKQEEVDYFCFALTLWTSKIKFKFNKHSKKDYESRTQTYLQNLKQYFEMEESDTTYKLDYRTFIDRNDMYRKLFESGTSSIFKMFSRNTYAPSVERLIENTFVESASLKKLLVKDLSKWAFERAYQFDQQIGFY